MSINIRILMEPLFQEYSRNKMQGSLVALQQLQQKSSPLSGFGLAGRQLQRKPTLFESRFCKELLNEHFEKVSSCTDIKHRAS